MAADGDHRPAITVVVMGYRNAPTIVDAVRSVLDQIGARDDDGTEAEAEAEVEVVVVVSGDDSSERRVREAFPALELVASHERLSPGGARNAGLAVARGDVVAFLAADCTAAPGWVDGRRRAHAAGHRIVASAVANATPRRPAAWGYHVGLFGRRLPGRPAGPVAPTDPGAHGCSFARAALDRLGGFDATLDAGEDTAAVEALGALGETVWFAPDVVTRHPGPRSVVGLARARARRGAARGRRTGPVAASAAGVARAWWRGLRRYRTVVREAGGDRRWVVLSLPWAALGDLAGLVAQQRGSRAPVRRSSTSPAP